MCSLRTLCFCWTEFRLYGACKRNWVSHVVGQNGTKFLNSILPLFGFCIKLHNEVILCGEVKLILVRTGEMEFKILNLLLAVFSYTVSVSLFFGQYSCRGPDRYMKTRRVFLFHVSLLLTCYEHGMPTCQGQRPNLSSLYFSGTSLCNHFFALILNSNQNMCHTCFSSESSHVKRYKLTVCVCVCVAALIGSSFMTMLHISTAFCYQSYHYDAIIY